MEGDEILSKLEKIRFDIFILLIGIFFIIGGVYVYLNYYLKQTPKDQVTGLMSALSFFLAYVTIAYGLAEFSNNYNRENEMIRIKHDIEMIKKKQELKRLIKKYKIKEEKSKLGQIKHFLKKIGLSIWTNVNKFLGKFRRKSDQSRLSICSKTKLR